MINGFDQINASYKRSCFDKDVRARLPGMSLWVMTGDVTAPFSFGPYWTMQDDNEELGGGFLKFKIIEGENHFVSVVF